MPQIFVYYIINSLKLADHKLFEMLSSHLDLKWQICALHKNISMSDGPHNDGIYHTA